MIIKNLNVIKLHGHYNYENITFFNDVTFLYGLNGSGKTTILNIIESIITGQVQKLFEFEFSEIKLTYCENIDTDTSDLVIRRLEENKIIIFFDHKHYEVENNFNRESKRNDREIKDWFFSTYPILVRILETFNYVYLPLNRSSKNEQDIINSEYYWIMRQRKRKGIEKERLMFNENSSDPMMSSVEVLIYTSYNKINMHVNKINDKFRNEILKSTLNIARLFKNSDNKETISSLFSSFKNERSIKDIQRSYIKILRDLSLIKHTDDETSINDFFDNLQDRYLQITRNSDANLRIEINDIVNFYEVRKAKELVDLAKKAEEEKSKVKKPINDFIDTINSFFDNDPDGKRFTIDETGSVFFVTKHTDSQLSIHNLSSGEKQLINFFANLIFRVNSKDGGIFVVDEPELSLHLSWQKTFVDKTISLNRNIQLIFATHSPEIVGKFRQRMVYLEKVYID